MPRAFLVKRRSPQPAVRSWDGLPDEERADTYIPGGIGCVLLGYEDSCSLESSGSSGTRDAEPSDPPTPQPAPGDLGAAGGMLLDLAVKRPVVRSKIKFTTGTCNDATVHSCELCGKGFRLQRMLNRHIKCHSQVKRHLCTFCGKGFNDTFDLKRHVRTHTGQSRQQQHMHSEIARPETGKAKEKPDVLQVSSESNKSFKDQSKIQEYFSKLSFKHSCVLRHLGSLKAKPVYQLLFTA